jgi:hypothetical protein
MKYFDLHGFENVYLEDSYVLSFEVGINFLEIALDLVLTESHLLFNIPEPGFQYCYKSAFIIFNRIELLKWSNKNLRGSIDTNGEIDFGNIDSFFFENGHYYLEGDWGDLDIVSEPPTLKIQSDSYS